MHASRFFSGVTSKRRFGTVNRDSCLATLQGERYPGCQRFFSRVFGLGHVVTRVRWSAFRHQASKVRARETGCMKVLKIKLWADCLVTNQINKRRWIKGAQERKIAPVAHQRSLARKHNLQSGSILVRFSVWGVFAGETAPKWKHNSELK